MSDTFDPGTEPAPAPGTAPAPASAGTADWEPPADRQEFKFTGDIAAAPDWVDKGWAGYDNGPALHVPAGDLWGTGPYTTKTARAGDTIVFVPAEGAKVAHFEVLQGDMTPEEGGTIKPAQASQASLEDLVRLGYLTPDQIGDDAKGQVMARTPALRKLIEKGVGAPEAQEPPVFSGAGPAA